MEIPMANKTGAEELADQSDRYRVIIVDDEPKAAFQIAAILETKGFDIVVASDGLEALEKFQTQPANLVITDWQMPKMDGAALIMTLRKGAPTLPVIVMTGKVDADVMEFAESKSETYLFNKPIDLRELLTKLQSLRNADSRGARSLTVS